MKNLGSVYQPDQYASSDEECILSDSLVALDFFKDFYKQEGLVFLSFFHLASTEHPSLPVWVYVDVKKGSIVAAAPVFKLNDTQTIADLAFIDAKLVEDEIFFYWKDHLYANAFTSTGEIIVRRIRCILCDKDMWGIAELDKDVQIDSIYPVKLYAEDDGRFLAVCWAIEANQNQMWYETVCADDDKYIDHVDVNKTVSYPINIGEKVILGDDFYGCHFNQNFGTYFEKTPIKALPMDRQRENIPLPKRPKKDDNRRSTLKIVTKEEIKEREKKKNSPLIIPFSFKK